MAYPAAGNGGLRPETTLPPATMGISPAGRVGSTSVAPDSVFCHTPAGFTSTGQSIVFRAGVQVTPRCYLLERSRNETAGLEDSRSSP